MAPGDDDGVATSEERQDEASRLIVAALGLMVEEGHIDPKVRDIVRLAGLSNQAFYRHFPTKQALIHAVVHHAQGNLIAYIEREIAAAPDPEARVVAWMNGVLQAAASEDGLRTARPFVIHAGRLADEFPDQAMDRYRQLAVPLNHAVADMGAPPHDARLVYDLTMSTMEHRVMFGIPLTAAQVDHAIEFVIEALRHRAAANAARNPAAAGDDTRNTV